MTFPKRQNHQSLHRPLIVVGSQNPVKLQCVENAFMEVFGSAFTITGLQVASGVSDQPMNSKETLIGAKNRVGNSKNLLPEADYWVGIEGGIDRDDQGMYAFAWICITDKNGCNTQAQTGTFYLPAKVSKLIEGGMELGHADDQVFGQSNSKQKGGSVGLLTKGKISRAEYYTPAIILALIPYINKDLYTS